MSGSRSILAVYVAFSLFKEGNELGCSRILVSLFFDVELVEETIKR